MNNPLVDLFASSEPTMSLTAFFVRILLVVFFTFILSKIYITYGQTISNRKSLGHILILISVTTMIVIAIVKSSLALSLGLVGALSIVRFRTAIKSPEELAYLFLAIGIGLGMGAGQIWVTIIGFGVTASYIIIASKFDNHSSITNLFLTVSTTENKKIELSQIIEILNKNCEIVNLKSYDEDESSQEISFSINLINITKMENTKSELFTLNNSIQISFLDSKGIPG